MNELNDKGQRHGYWITEYNKLNYYNGTIHGKYEFYHDKGKTILCRMGLYDMGRRVGYWVLYNNSNQLTLKVFHL